MKECGMCRYTFLLWTLGPQTNQLPYRNQDVPKSSFHRWQHARWMLVDAQVFQNYCGRLRLLLCSASRILKSPSSATVRWAFWLASYPKVLPDLKPNAIIWYFVIINHLKRSSESLPYKIKQGRLVVKIHQKYQLQHPSNIIFWLQLRLDASHHFVKSWAHRPHGIGDQVLGISDRKFLRVVNWRCFK